VNSTTSYGSWKQEESLNAERKSAFTRGCIKSFRAAIQHNQDELARQALVQRDQHLRAAEIVRRSLEEVEAQAVALREGISHLESQIAMAKLEQERNT
jgi:phage shock protein A